MLLDSVSVSGDINHFALGIQMEPAPCISFDYYCLFNSISQALFMFSLIDVILWHLKRVVSNSVIKILISRKK